MFGLTNKKMTGRVLGRSGTYSLSFMNCELEWQMMPSLEKLLKLKRKNIDHVFGIPASAGNVKSDVILLTFVVGSSSDVASHFETLMSKETLAMTDVNEQMLPIVALYQIHGGKYEIEKVEKILVGEAQMPALKIDGKTEDALKPTEYTESIFVPSSSSVLILDLILTDIEEVKASEIKADFAKIAASLKGTL